MTATVATAIDAAPRRAWGERIDRHSGRLMVLPAVIVLLCFAIFPLIISAYLALSRFALAPGGFTLKFVGLLNFKKLLTGSQQYHLLGTFGALGARPLARARAGRRGCSSAFSPATSWAAGRRCWARSAGCCRPHWRSALLARRACVTFAPGGVPGTLVNTLLYVVVGVTAQFAPRPRPRAPLRPADPRPQLLPRRSSSCR